MLNPVYQQEEPVELPGIPIELEGEIEAEIAEPSSTDFTPEQLAVLGDWSAREFQAAESIRDQKLKEWEENRKHYANQPIPFVSTITDGEATDIPINMASTKADALRDLVVGNLFSVKPWFVPSVYGVDAAEMHKLDALMQRILEKTELEERCKESSEDSWATNHAIFRVYFDAALNEYRIDNVDPECFVVGGGDKFGIENSVLVGHSYNERKADIAYAIEEGDLFDYPNENTVDKEHDTDPMCVVRLAQLFVKFDPERLKKDLRVCPVKQWHIITLDVDAKHILKIEKFTLSDRPWYFSGSYLPCKKTGGFWSKHSLGSFMQGPHIAANIVLNTSIFGGVSRAFPPTVADGEMTDQTQRLSWGKTKTTYGASVTAPYQQFDPSTLDLLSTRIERIGDGVARISQAASGMTFNKGMTATEAQIIAESQGQGVSGYVSTFALTLEEMVAYIYSTLKFTAGKILEGMDPSLQPADAGIYSKDAVWVATGRGQFASPGLRMAQLDKVDEMSRDPRLVGKFDPSEIAESKLSLMALPNKERLFDRNAEPPPAPPVMAGGPLGGPPEGVPMQGPAEPEGPSLFA